MRYVAMRYIAIRYRAMRCGTLRYCASRTHFCLSLAPSLARSGPHHLLPHQVRMASLDLSSTQAVPPCLLRWLMIELQLQIAAQLDDPADFASLCLAAPRLGRLALKSLKHSNTRRFELMLRRYAGDPRSEQAGCEWLKLNGGGWPFIHVDIMERMESGSEVGENDLKEQWCLKTEEGKVLIQERYHSGIICHYEGERGSERMVRRDFSGLIMQLTSGDAAGKANAAGALANLASTNSDNQLAIAQANVIPHLIALVKRGDAAGKANAARALWNLVHGPSTKEPLTKKQAIINSQLHFLTSKAQLFIYSRHMPPPFRLH